MDSADAADDERLTYRARRVVALAREEARALGHGYVGCEHLLLGLIRDGGAAAGLLEALGISPGGLRDLVEEIIGQGQDRHPAAVMPLTPRATKSVELALTEAVRLGHTQIGTEHLLLGVVREGESVPAQVLARQGADLDRVRRQVST